MNLLYKDCIQFEYNNYIYAPLHNEPLDEELFNHLTSKTILYSSDSDKITVASKMNHYNYNEPNISETYLMGDLTHVGNINIYNSSECEVCELNIPFDMDYYKYKDDNEYCVCKLCIQQIDQTNFIQDKHNSGIDNLRDWICIYRYIARYSQYCLYCNLNKNSIHYAKFAINNCNDNCRNSFKIIENTSIDEILINEIL